VQAEGVPAGRTGFESRPVSSAQARRHEGCGAVDGLPLDDVG
jgi:hypothetical protein